MNASAVEENEPAEADRRVAVVGMAGRFPGAGSVDELWDLLRSGTETVSRFTPEELRAAGVPAAEAEHPNYVPAKGILEDVAGFDAQLFGYGSLEASVIDPQQRIFLECAWSALEDAGCDPDRSAGPIGVFGGSMLSTYLIHNLLGRHDLRAALGVPMIFQSNQPDGLAARTAYKLNLRGPAISVQTACSSSLVAVHLAVQSLLTEECDLALAGGVTVTLPHRAGYLPVPGGIESPDGHCRPYSAQAGGTVFGNGAAVVVLKRLSDALADGDRVYAVVLGSAVNNDGNAKAGYTAPGFDGQVAVIREALAVADVPARSIGYVEGHGSGTAIGDAIEVEALVEAFQDEPGQVVPGSCGLGSVKGNLGHLDTASGITGFVKAVQVLRHGRIPASLHSEKADARVTGEGSPFFVPDRLTDWPLAAGPRRAGVSSFGIGGTNAHVVLEEAPGAGPQGEASPGRSYVLPLSARTGPALDALGARLLEHLEARPQTRLDDLARTLGTGRRRLTHRTAVVASDGPGVLAALRSPDRRTSVRARTDREDAPVAFLLPGQGAWFPAAATGLYAADPVFRQALDECAEILRPELDLDLVELLGTAPELNTALAQPVLVSIGYALARRWAAWGVRPAALLGHSIGELTAALLAGVLDLPDALRLSVRRGRLMQDLAPGAMVAVPLSPEEAEVTASAHGLDLAAVNGPQACVLSGPVAAVEAAIAELTGRGARPVRLAVDRAFHSAAVEPGLDRFAEAVAAVPRRSPSIPFVSGVTGDWITDEEATDPGYWARQMRSPVRFHDGLRSLLGLDQGLVLVENGPGSVLTDLVRAAGRTAPGPRTAPPPLPSRGGRGSDDEPASLALSLAGLWTHGVPVVWEPTGGRVIDLPGYPFERSPHWIEPATVSPSAPPGADTPGGGPAPAGAPAMRSVTVWTPAGEAGTATEAAPRRHTWLVLMDEGGAAQPFVDRITARGNIITIVTPGPEYRRVGRGRYQLDPADPAQYERLFTELRGLVRTPTAVLHAWALDPAVGGPDGTDGYFGLVRLARAMSAANIVNDVQLGVVTAGALQVTAEERPDPAGALLSGPVLVLPEEYPNLHCVLVDLPPGPRPADSDSDADADAVLRAVLAPPARLTALRDGQLLVRRAGPVEPVPDAPEGERPPGRTWVLTGGFGGLGQTLATYLAREGRARLALIGRSDCEQGRPAEILAELRAAGVEVLGLRADVSDAAALTRALDEVRARFGRIDGVVHAAGVPGGGSVDRRDDGEMRAVMAAKTTGTRNLLAGLQPGEAGVLVLCSSLATRIPTYGQSDYTAANAALAALGEAEAAAGARRVITVDWDMVAEVGMASRAVVSADLVDRQQRMLAGALTPDQVTRAFAGLVQGPGGRFMVARESATVDDRGQLRLTADDAPAPAITVHARPDLETPYEAPRTPTEQQLARIYADLFGLDRVGIHDDFLQLGGHSLLAAQVVARLRSEFGVDVPARVFFDGGRVADLAAEIEEQILAELEAQ